MDVSECLCDAVREGRVQRVSELMNTYGLSYSSDWLQGYVLLALAAENGHSEVVKLLLKKGAKVNYENGEGFETPLHLAAGNLEIVKMFINSGVDIDARDEKGRTVLHIASHCGYKEVVKLLLEHSAEVNSKTKYGVTPLHWAAEGGYLEIIKTLLKFGADVETRSKDTRTALHIASLFGHYEVVKVLLEHGAEVDSETDWGYMPLHWSAEGGYLELIEAFLKFDDDDARRSSRTALHIASHRGHNNVVKVLLEHGANVDFKIYGLTPLHTAAEGGYLDVIKTLLKFGADVKATHKDRTALHIASNHGYEQLVKLLLEHGAEVNSKTCGYTPLHTATEKGFLKVTETLLKFGADVNTRHEDGRTALFIASQRTSPEIVNALLKYGADINIATTDNRTPLDFVGYSAAEPLQRHKIKLKTANLYLSQKNLLLMNRYIKKYSNFQKECEREITNMKDEKFNNSKISFYDILTKTNLSTYMRNENILEALKSGEYKKKFPIYADILENNFRKAMERKYLLEQVTIFDNLPCECTEEIFSYLTNKEITAFIIAYKPLWRRGEDN